MRDAAIADSPSQNLSSTELMEILDLFGSVEMITQAQILIHCGKNDLTNKCALLA
jgi:hypothetical protein